MVPWVTGTPGYTVVYGSGASMAIGRRCAAIRFFSSLWQLFYSEGLSMEVAQMLGSQGPWWHSSVQAHGLPKPKERWPYYSFLVSSSWQSESLFVWSISVALAHSGSGVLLMICISGT